MQGRIVLVLGINPISCKSSSQSVASVVHDRDGGDGLSCREALAAAVDDAADGASAWYTDLSFQRHSLVIAVHGVYSPGMKKASTIDSLLMKLPLVDAFVPVVILHSVSKKREFVTGVAEIYPIALAL